MSLRWIQSTMVKRNQRVSFKWHRQLAAALKSELANIIVRIGALLGVIATATGIWYSYDAFQRSRISEEKDTTNRAWTLVGSAANQKDGGNVGLLNALELLAERRVNLGQLRLPQAYLPRIKLPNVRMDGAALPKANLDEANLSSAEMQGANLAEASLASVNLSRANVSAANLTRSNLRRAKLDHVNLRGADLSGADLSGADLRNADLRGARLQRANLFRANLSGATLDLADLSEANLSVANLLCSTLRGTNLWQADIRAADMSEARLDGAVLRDADLRRTNLSRAMLETTIFEAKNLENACWENPPLLPPGMTVTRPTFETKWCGRPSDPISTERGRTPDDDAANSFRQAASAGLLAAKACPQGAVTAAKETIAYLIPSRIDEFQTESQKAIEVVFDKLGYVVESFDAEGDSNVQIRQFENAIAKKPKAIILNAVDSVLVAPTIQKANRQQIPVLVYDRAVAMAPRSAKISIAFSSIANAYGIGQMAATEAIQLLRLNEGGQTPSIGGVAPSKRILHIPGDPRDDYSLEVQRGFEAKMRTMNNVTITTKPAIDWEPRDAEKILRDEQSREKAVVFDLIFAHASHLIEPLLTLAKEPTPIFISANGAPNGLKNLRQGKQQREIEQPLYAQVYGLAHGFREIVVRKQKLSSGPCNIIGIAGQIEESEIGPILKLDGSVITPEHLKTGEHSYWGNFVPPQYPVQELRCGS